MIRILKVSEIEAFDRAASLLGKRPEPVEDDRLSPRASLGFWVLASLASWGLCILAVRALF